MNRHSETIAFLRNRKVVSEKSGNFGNFLFERVTPPVVLFAPGKDESGRRGKMISTTCIVLSRGVLLLAASPLVVCQRFLFESVRNVFSYEKLYGTAYFGFPAYVAFTYIIRVRARISLMGVEEKACTGGA